MIDGPAFQYVTVENRGLDAGTALLLVRLPLAIFMFFFIICHCRRVEKRGLDAGRYWELRTPVHAWTQLEQGVRYSMTAPGPTAHRLFRGKKGNPI